MILMKELPYESIILGSLLITEFGTAIIALSGWIFGVCLPNRSIESMVVALSSYASTNRTPTALFSCDRVLQVLDAWIVVFRCCCLVSTS
jgi:hypothetical protein